MAPLNTGLHSLVPMSPSSSVSEPLMAETTHSSEQASVAQRRTQCQSPPDTLQLAEEQRGAEGLGRCSMSPPDTLALCLPHRTPGQPLPHQLSQLGHVTMTLPESHSATPVPVRARGLGSEYHGATGLQVHSGWIRRGQTGFATGAARELTPAVGADEETGFS